MSETNRRLMDKFALRLPDGLRDKLAERARENNRSTNAEIVARLERSIADDVPDFVTGNRVDNLSKEIESLRADLRALGATVNGLKAKAS